MLEHQGAEDQCVSLIQSRIKRQGCVVLPAYWRIPTMPIHTSPSKDLHFCSFQWWSVCCSSQQQGPVCEWKTDKAVLAFPLSALWAWVPLAVVCSLLTAVSCSLLGGLHLRAGWNCTLRLPQGLLNQNLLLKYEQVIPFGIRVWGALWELKNDFLRVWKPELDRHQYR